MTRILNEAPEDLQAVEYLYDLTFAPGRTALSSYRLRDGIAPVANLSLVIKDEFDAIVAAIRFWPIRIGKAGHAALLLGPVAVHPTRQGEGLGAQLVAASLDRARAAGWQRVMLVGDEPYYRRFGFTRQTALAIEFPPPTNPDRLLAQELVEGAFEGVSGMVRRWVDQP